jgi:hypothetical protein
MKISRLFFVFLFSLMLAVAIKTVLPEVNPFLASVAITLVLIAAPLPKGVLSMNGIVAREDFKIASKIFMNAFNPRKLASGADNPKFDPNWDPVSAFKLTQSELRLEQPLVTTAAQYTFPVLSNIQNQAQQFPSEIRLNLQDSFVPVRLGVYVALPSSTSSTAFSLHTYFNSEVFASYAAEEALYNGQLKLMINNQQYINGWGLVRHRKVNQTQQVAAAAVGALIDQFDGSEDGMYPIQPFVLLLGSQNIQLNIVLPNALTAVDAGARLILRFEGVLAQNSTVVN